MIKEMYYGLIAALVVALILTVVLAAVGRRGPWGSAWTFFLVLFLALWMVSLYIRSIGPVYLGIAWVPIVVAGILLAFLLAAAIPDARTWRNESVPDIEDNQLSEIKSQKDDVRNTGTGRFFWILILLMITAIIIGMTYPQPAL